MKKEKVKVEKVEGDKPIIYHTKVIDEVEEIYEILKARIEG